MALFTDILLTADYDRTMTDMAGQVPEKNLEAIRYFMENGGTFTINTGRSLPQSAIVRETVPMNAPFICYNGSLIVDEKDEFLFCKAIDLPLEQTLREVCAAFPDLNVDLHGVAAHVGFQPVGCWETYYAARKCSYYLADGRDHGPFVKFNVFGELRDDTFYQIFSGTPEEIARVDAAERWLKETYGDKMTVFRAGARVLNVHAPNVSKLKAARLLQEKLDKKILVCVGDADNDLPMLEGADYAFCPSDGTIADQFPNVCPCGEGAVADVIYNELPKILS